jgi:dTDP-4-amino-4,6-dideoxygalactose transaminase
VSPADLPAVLGGAPLFPDRLPLVRPTLDDVPGLTKRLGAVLESGMLTNGPVVRELEERVAARLGVEHVVGVSSCTAGLMLVYQALGAGSGTRVVLPSFTFAASAHAVVWAGAAPDFCDVTAERCSLDVAALEAVLDDGERPAAVSATHVYGHPAEVEAIDALAARRGVPVVYDAAHALGSERRGTPIGGFGAAEVFSLSPTKVVVAGEGGLVATNDAELAATIRLGRDYGNPGDYDCRFPGINARLSELHATVAIASLEGLDAHIAHRQALVERFGSAVAGIPGLRITWPAEGDRSTWKDLTLVVDAAVFGMDVVALRAALDAEGIDSRRYYHPPIHRQVAYEGRWAAPRDLPCTDALSVSVITPPLWSHLTTAQIDRMGQAVVRIHEQAAAIRDLAPTR